MKKLLHLKIELIVSFLLCMNLTHLKGQLFFTEVGCGFGSYSMLGLKNFQELKLQSEKVPLKILDNFPATYYYTVTVTLKYGEWGIGLIGSYSSTGSRMNYADYSGEMNTDIITSAYSIGHIVELDFYQKNNFSLVVCGGIPFIFSKIQFNNHLSIYDYKKSDSNLYKLTSIGFLFDVKLRYAFSNLFFDLNSGCLLDNSGNIEGTNIQTDWSGIRINMSAGLKF